MGDICDFCGTSGCTWEYDVRAATTVLDTDLGEGESAAIVTEQTGAWLGCDPCHDLIEAENERGLAERAADLTIQRNKWPASVRDKVVDLLRANHAPFWQGRQGAPRRLPARRG